MLAPLDVDSHLPAVAPVHVEQRPVPEGPDIRRGAGRVVADPDDLFVRRDGKRHPGPVNIVAPEKMVGDDRPSRVEDGNYPLEGEPFVTLNV